jgi:hypothetical protein
MSVNALPVTEQQVVLAGQSAPGRTRTCDRLLRRRAPDVQSRRLPRILRCHSLRSSALGLSVGVSFGCHPRGSAGFRAEAQSLATWLVVARGRPASGAVGWSAPGRCPASPELIAKRFGSQVPVPSAHERFDLLVAVDGSESCALRGKAGSSQRRNTGGLSEASSAANSSAGDRSPRTCLGRLLISFSTASR